MEQEGVTATVIIPFHRQIRQLRASLGAVRTSMPAAQVIIAADGADEDCAAVAASHDAVVVVVPRGPVGPAVARNRAAAIATGDVLLFVDTDVVPAADALPGMCALLAATPSIEAVFGAYDLHPPAANFASQFKNLSHAYVHGVGQREATTFWAGLGAVRRTAFLGVGGFDERFGRPSVEDIDLGYRLRAAGGAIRLDPTFRGTHLKRWTVAGCVRTDVRDRGVPWVQLLHRHGRLADDLNTTRALRAAIVVSYALVAATLLAPWLEGAGVVAIALLASLVMLQRDYYAWFVARRGWWFGIRVVAMDVLHHLCNGLSFIVGTVLHVASRAGVMLPGALPRGPWPTDAANVLGRPR